MTDKLKELVAKWRDKATRWSLAGPMANRQTVDALRYCADELEALLSEQAPAGEFDAWWSKYIADVDSCHGKRNIARDAYAAGRSSQAEQRDPAAK